MIADCDPDRWSIVRTVWDELLQIVSSDVEEASSTALAAVRVKAFETKNATQKWLSEGARATELRQTLSESEMAVVRCPKKGSILIRRNTLSTGTDIY